MTGSGCQLEGPHALMTSGLALLFGIFLTFFTVPAYAACGTLISWENDNASCPHRAVCADKYYMNVQRGKTTCIETFVIHRCMCSGQTICPFNDLSYQLYSNPKTMLYVCQPVCQLPYCDENQVALSSFKTSPNFRGRFYETIDCRCIRHHVPVDIAVDLSHSTNDSNHFACVLSDEERNMTDPCSN